MDEDRLYDLLHSYNEGEVSYEDTLYTIVEFLRNGGDYKIIVPTELNNGLDLVSDLLQMGFYDEWWFRTSVLNEDFELVELFIRRGVEIPPNLKHRKRSRLRPGALPEMLEMQRAAKQKTNDMKNYIEQARSVRKFPDKHRRNQVYRRNVHNYSEQNNLPNDIEYMLYDY
jgi:hypothetical protein